MGSLMNRKFFAQNLWLWKTGKREVNLDISEINLEELKRTEWSPEFESFMRNRLILGALRYGRLGIKNKPKYDRVKDAIGRLLLYEKTGNQELLIDVSNLMLCEFVEGDHPNKHFLSEDDGKHTEIIK